MTVSPQSRRGGAGEELSRLEMKEERLHDSLFPQDGDSELLSVAAAGWESDVTALLSALVLWTQSRRQEGRGRPVRLCGQGNHLSASCPRVSLCVLSFSSFISSPLSSCVSCLLRRLLSNRHGFAVLSTGSRQRSTCREVLRASGLCRESCIYFQNIRN